MKRELVIFSWLLSLACVEIRAQGLTLVQPPRTKAVELTGSEALMILGIQAFKTEVRFTRPQQITRVTMVVGRLLAGKIHEEETALEEYHGMPPVTAFKVGLAWRPDTRLLTTIAGDGMISQTASDGFTFDYPSLAPDGIYDNGLVIFAYEPRDKSKRPATKNDCLRYLGMRVYLKS